jgi:hypothetical protein
MLPDGQFQWAAGLAPYRMNLVFDWDDLPHLLSLALTPLAAWLLSRALESRRLRQFPDKS